MESSHEKDLKVAVGMQPLYQEVVGLNPAGCWGSFSAVCPQNKTGEKVSNPA